MHFKRTLNRDDILVLKNVYCRTDFGMFNTFLEKSLK